MARTMHVKAARKKQPACMSPDCRKESREINVGDSYQWFSIRSHRGGRGTRKVYHEGCPIPQSHRTTSAQLGMIYDAQEAAEKEISNLDREQDADALQDELQGIAQAAAEGIREAATLYEEGADNIESGFGHSTYISDELREKAESVNGWADEIEQCDFDSFDGEDGEEFDDASVRREIEVEVATELGVKDAASVAPLDLLDAVMNIEWEGPMPFDFEEEVNRRVDEKEREHEAENEQDDGAKDEWLDEQITKLEDALQNSPL